MFAGDIENVPEFVQPKLLPKDIKALLDLEVIGQENAKKALSVEIYNHYKRINNLSLEIQKSNIMLIGNSGTGKTLLMQTLAKILDIPMTIVNTANYSSAGFKGADIEDMVQALVAAADNDIRKAETGIILLDECFPGYVEVYTRDGFTRFDKLKDGVEVLQYNEDGSLEFVTPIRNICKEYEGELYKISTDRWEHISTPNHNRVMISPKGKLTKIKAHESMSEAFKFPVSGKFKNDTNCNLTDDQIKFWVAFSADGTLKNKETYGYMSLLKERKITRMRGILDNLKLQYTETKSTKREGFVSFYFGRVDSLGFLVKNFKLFDRETLLSFNDHQRDLFLSEIVFWDGYTDKHGSIDFTTSKKDQAELIMELSHLNNTSSHIGIQRYEKYDDSYKVHISPKNHKSQQRRNIEYIPYSENVYCVEVASNMIMIRCNDSVQISGNCDKIAKRNTSSMDLDVSGLSVQQELLKIVEGTNVKVKIEGSRRSQFTEQYIDTSNILFVAAGAFFGLEKILEHDHNKETSGIGFSASVEKSDYIEKEITDENIIHYGFIPEFVGRFPVIVKLDKLTKEDYRRILTEPKNSIIDQYKNLMEIDNIKLNFTDEYLDGIVEKVFKSDRGARALRSEIEKTMRDKIFEINSESFNTEITIN
jgi:ATP-dependent protease Clp ATPase subunit